MASEYTPNYNLDKYVGTDKPNLRDQYNSAMDKIDAQFVAIENDHTETNNQISAINTNMAQLGERVTEAEGQISQTNTNMTQLGERVTAAEGQISQTNTALAAVKQTAENANSQAENANSQANTNASAIKSINTQLGTVQQEVGDLQGKTRSLVLFEASNTSEAMALNSTADFWGEDVGTLNAGIPDWANWIDFHFFAANAEYWKQGATAFNDTVAFVSPAICQTFPAKRIVQDGSSNAFVSQTITNFAIVLPPLMGVQIDDGSGIQKISFGNVPFKIDGKVVTQNMGVDTTGDSGGSFKNSYGGAAMLFKTNTPECINSQQSVYLLKVVARA